MYNNATPDAGALPSARKLLRSTFIAIAIAAALLVTVVLPAEYAIDPTGVGRVLGLTEMGKIKAQLAKEAAADSAMDAGGTGRAMAASPAAAVSQASVTSPATASGTASATTAEPADAAVAWRDEMQVVLQPGEGAEIKLTMKAGERAQFSWLVQGGMVNFDTHGDGGGEAISYEKGRGVSSDDGEVEAAFDGNHGWFWRNRGTTPVTVVVRTRGQYSSMKRLV